MTKTSRHKLLIASYLEQEQVERLRQVDPRLDVVYQPELLRPPRYAADHKGGELTRSEEQESHWQSLLAEAEILFDFDQTHLEDLPELTPKLEWIQATSAGIGQFVRRMGYATRMPRTIYTTASGVHAVPLAEFCIMAMLMFTKHVPGMMRMQEQRQWRRYAGTDLRDRTLVILGMGRVGKEIARIAQAFHMNVLGIKRDLDGIEAQSLHLDELHPSSELPGLLTRAEFLILCLPHTDETEGMINAEQLSLLPAGAVLVNVSRGAVVDEPALIAALQSGDLGAAALDVYAEEPLPRSSPLWAMANVLVSPHSGSTSDRENQRITDLFCENLRRYLDGRELLNLLDLDKLY